MHIDLNQPENLTIAAVRQLLASASDDVHTQLRVTKTGIASAFPGVPIARIAGGHDHNGEAVQPLDVAALTANIQAMSPGVTAFAIASSFAVRNNAHELAARDLVTKLTGKPVTLSSELSNALDAPRRPGP